MNWQKKNEGSFTLLFQKNSFAEKNVEDILHKESQCIDKVCTFLQVDSPFNLNIYLFPSLTFKKKYFGGTSLGYSDYRTKSVGYVFNKTWKNNIATCHEETHIFCMLWGGKHIELDGKIINSLPGLYEGLAMYIQSVLYYEYFYRNTQVLPPKGMTLNQGIIGDIRNHNVPNIFDILTYEGYSNNLKNGAQLGSITGYLIDTFGLVIFKDIYLNVSEKKSLKDNIQVFEKKLHLSSSEINGAWKDYVIHNPHFKRHATLSV